jgi:hypothetical protein
LLHQLHECRNTVTWAFHPEDGGSKVVRNVDILPHQYTVSQPGRPQLGFHWIHNLWNHYNCHDMDNSKRHFLPRSIVTPRYQWTLSTKCGTQHERHSVYLLHFCCFSTVWDIYGQSPSPNHHLFFRTPKYSRALSYFLGSMATTEKPGVGGRIDTWTEFLMFLLRLVLRSMYLPIKAEHIIRRSTLTGSKAM